jgi:hypothetical protein
MRFFAAVLERRLGETTVADTRPRKGAKAARATKALPAASNRPVRGRCETQLTIQ